jgi:hypothetical protein
LFEENPSHPSIVILLIPEVSAEFPSIEVTVVSNAGFTLLGLPGLRFSFFLCDSFNSIEEFSVDLLSLSLVKSLLCTIFLGRPGRFLKRTVTDWMIQLTKAFSVVINKLQK